MSFSITFIICENDREIYAVSFIKTTKNVTTR